MAVNPDEEGKFLKAYVFEKKAGKFSLLGEKVMEGVPSNAKADFWLGGKTVQFDSPNFPRAVVRYDISEHEWISVVWDMWLSRQDEQLLSNKRGHLPFTFAVIRRDYFPKGKRKENYWRTFTAKNGDADSAFVVDAQDGECVVYACIPSQEMKILRGFPIPQEVGFPLHFRCNFSSNTGVFCVNRKLYGTFDFDSYQGERCSEPRNRECRSEAIDPEMLHPAWQRKIQIISTVFLDLMAPVRYIGRQYCKGADTR